jgi:type IV secretory pathway TrbF-like protein
MDWNKRTEKYTAPQEPQTPYTRAQAEWDNRIGSARVQARNWRMATFLLSVLSLILALGLIQQASQVKIHPYIVHVDNLGQVQAVQPAVQNYSPTQAEIHHFLAFFIDRVRSLPMDPVVLKKNLTDAYQLLSQTGQNQLQEHANQILQRVGQETISVEVISVLAISPSSYQIHWKESVFTNKGVPVSSERFSGIFNIQFRTPRTEKELLSNPLGILINSFNWSKQL